MSRRSKDYVANKGKCQYQSESPDASVDVVRLKSRHAMGPSCPERTSKRRPERGNQGETKRERETIGERERERERERE